MTGERRLLVASRNPKKLEELRRILDRAQLRGLRLLGLDEVGQFPEPVEDAASFEDNALIKARAAVRATGIATVADDSGLAIEALQGMPGVLSARWSGGGGDEDNLRLLLAQLHDVPDSRRWGRFICAAALVTPGDADHEGAAPGIEVVTRGEWPGRVVREPAGSGGFGYDPIFVPEGNSGTVAELDPGRKDVDSHRARALRQLVPALRGLAPS